MTGQILIVDALATNRIVLKAKLSAAFFVVKQASSGREAAELCVQDPPDLVIMGNSLPDMQVSDLIRRLERVCPSPTPPVLMLLPQEESAARFEALKAGAADVMARPFDEDELFARLRALLRQRRVDSDLVMHVNTASALGFSEDPIGFSGPERAAVLAATPELAVRICNRLRPFCRYDLLPGTYAKAAQICDGPAQPDIAILHIGDGETDGLRGLAELQAGAMSRDLRLIALLDETCQHSPAKLLDMGACDVVTCPGQDRELAFRLTLQMVRKKRVDTLRGQLEHGLQAAVLDPLTGLHNRRYAQVFLRRLIDQSQATETSFAVMIADLDHFKSVNDTHGHATGDRVLVRTAAAMRDTLPNGAMIARIGGEEFLIAVPDVTLAKVRQLAGRLGRAVRQAPIAIKDTNRSIHVTVSIGATLVNPAQTHRNISTEALIEQADRALYDSKSGGRDTVTVSLRPAA